jgi:tyrosyl-tRNA synthetase
MSKSLNNAIGIHEPPFEMYGKLMSISDDLMWKYWTLLTDLRQSEIAQMQSDVASGKLHPMQAKKNLAHSITTDFHSKAEADSAADNWAKQFQQRGVSEDVPVAKISLKEEGLTTPNEDGTTGIKIAKLLHLAGLAASTGEANRKIAENAVSINGEKFSGKTASLNQLGQSPILRLGKKSIRIEWLQ